MTLASCRCGLRQRLGVARESRIECPGAVYHVAGRGNGKKAHKGVGRTRQLFDSAAMGRPTTAESDLLRTSINPESQE
jgi:hypothetical protein